METTLIDWQTIDWPTMAIHAYAAVVLVLWFLVYTSHRNRLSGLAQRIANIAARIERRPTVPGKVRLDQLSILLLHLGDLVQHREDLEIAPVLEFVRHEERRHNHNLLGTLVNLTETMIELFPILGILGTVWAISGVGREDFSSERLLFLFGTAVSTTLYALLYAVLFRITYSAFVHGKVAALGEYNDRFLVFLTILEERSRDADVADLVNPWREKG
jgi:hypothetical protein